MIKKSALGKGLASLIPEENTVDDDNVVFKVSINSIRPNEDQPRKYFDPEKIVELAESIKEHGIIQPIILKKDLDVYTIIAGERRWRAAKSIGLKEVPAVIMDLSDKQVLEVSLIENIIREDLNPIEEALAYKKLMKDFDLTQEEISKKVSKSRSAIANCLRLLNLDKRVQDYLIDEVISEGHGRAILGIDNKETQYEIAQKVIDEDLNVRQTEKLIKNYGNDKNKKVNNKTSNPYYKDIADKLEGYFNTKVTLNEKNKNKGKIEIEYYSEDDLQRILELLKV
ncbi:ParB/RepB/Spo0J family partition protein [Clostridium sp.]|uniref:ParB/RepB/Spo0J family partition protein n=1 Tax=Clostridium sp. TaxID=1506 RepID=UPI002FC8F05F